METKTCSAEMNTCAFCRVEKSVMRQYLHAKNKPVVGDGFDFIYYCGDCGLLENISSPPPDIGLPPEKLVNIQNPSCIILDKTEWTKELDEKFARRNVQTGELEERWFVIDTTRPKDIKDFIRHLLFERDNYWLTEMNLAIGKDLEEQKLEILKELEERIERLEKLGFPIPPEEPEDTEEIFLRGVYYGFDQLLLIIGEIKK